MNLHVLQLLLRPSTENRPPSDEPSDEIALPAAGCRIACSPSFTLLIVIFYSIFSPSTSLSLASTIPPLPLSTRHTHTHTPRFSNLSSTFPVLSINFTPVPCHGNISPSFALPRSHFSGTPPGRKTVMPVIEVRICIPPDLSDAASFCSCLRPCLCSLATQNHCGGFYEVGS